MVETNGNTIALHDEDLPIDMLEARWGVSDVPSEEDLQPSVMLRN